MGPAGATAGPIPPWDQQGFGTNGTYSAVPALEGTSERG